MCTDELRVVGCTALSIVVLRAKFQGCSIFPCRDIFFGINLVLDQLEIDVVSILGVVPQECKVFNCDSKHKKLKERTISILYSKGSIECFMVQITVINMTIFCLSSQRPSNLLESSFILRKYLAAKTAFNKST